MSRFFLIWGYKSVEVKAWDKRAWLQRKTVTSRGTHIVAHPFTVIGQLAFE